MIIPAASPGASDAVSSTGVVPACGRVENNAIADRLDEVADVLEKQRANRFRIMAYHRAATVIRTWPESIAALAIAKGVRGLCELPGIGDRLSHHIVQLVMTGRLPMLERLRADTDPVELFGTLPGIGEKTARRISDELGIHTLVELEVAAHDGRLHQLGIGGKRLGTIRDGLARRLGQTDRERSTDPTSLSPVAEILDVDQEYRAEAQRGTLPMLAPRRFNPDHEAWLPVLHTERGDRHYTVLFSNTARAHELGHTRDWVVVFVDGDRAERQWTVVTATHGVMQGRRIVRGREAECLRYYEALPG